MSDVFNPLQQASADIENARRQMTNPLQGAAAATGEIQTKIDAQRSAHPDLPPMATWDYDIYDRVLPAIESSDDPEDTRERFNAAMLYSKLFDKPITDTYANLESYHSAWIGKSFTPKTSVKAIADSMALGVASLEYNNLGARLKASGGSDPEIEAQLAESLKKMERLQDNVPRPWYIDAVKMGAQSLPYTAMAAGAGIATAGIGGAIAGSAGLSAATMAAIKAGASIAGSGAASYAMMEGAEYADLRAQGVRHDIAAPVSSISALIQAGIEASLGNVAGAASKIGKTQVQTITGAVAKKLFVSGRTGALGKALMGYAGEAIEEGAEELLQSLASSAALEISAKLQKDGVETKTAEQVAKEAIENFKGGFLSSLVLGVPGTVTDYRGNATEARRVADLARTFDEKTFKAEAAQMNLSMFEGMNDTQKQEALTSIWKAQQGRKGTQNPIDNKVVDISGPSVAKPGPARRKDDGTLYVKAVDKGTGEGLIEQAKLQIGDPKSGTKYGEVKYRIDGDTVLVENVAAAQYLTDKTEVIHDALVELGAQHPGMNIEWNPSSPELESIRDRLVAENPRGKAAGIQWFEPGSNVSETRRAAVVGKAIKESFKTLSDDEVQTATTIVYETARSLGFRPEDVVGRSLELTTKEKIEKNPEIAAQIQQARQGMAAAQQEAGATLFMQDGELVGLQRASKEFERGMKAVIYAAENANLSTFTHEWFHFIDVAYIGRSEQHRRLFEDALGKRYDELTAEDREKLAYSFEQYLKDGSAPSDSLKSLFSRIAKAMARAISAIAKTMNISPELRKGFDALFQGDSQLKQDVNTDTAQEGSHGSKSVQPVQENEEPGNVPSKASDATTGRQEGPEIVFQMSAPEDTPAFRSWFRKSKAVNPDGSPMVLYHGTFRSFDKFDLSYAKEGEGAIFTTPSVELANEFTHRGPWHKNQSVSFGSEEANAVMRKYPEVMDALERSNDYRETIKEIAREVKDHLDELEGTKDMMDEIQYAERVQADKDRLNALGVVLRSLDSITVERDAGNIMPLYLSTQNPLVVDVAGESFNSQRMIDILNAARNQGHDGAIIKNIEDYGVVADQYVAFQPTQVKSVFNKGEWSQDDSRVLFQHDIEEVGPDLVAVHNISDRSLAFADEVGGIAMPSLAVIKKGIPFSNYGDITLIAPKDLIDPKANSAAKVFNADVYSPRYPDITYKVDEKILMPLAEEIASTIRAAYENSSDSFYKNRAPSKYTIIEFLKDAIGNNQVEYIGGKQDIKAYWLIKNEGLNPDIAELRSVDLTAEQQKQLQEWASKELERARGDAVIFKGFTNSGNRRYAPATIENIYAEMKKANIRGGESMNYGLPSIRALVAKQYKSLSAISKDKANIVSDEDFQKAKKDTDALYEEILHESYNSDTRYNFGDALAEGIGKGNIAAALKENGFNMGDEWLEKINLLLSSLREMPTHYFEAKIKGIVTLDQFVGAVIPDSASIETKEALKEAGLRIESYEAGNSEDRSNAIKRIAADDPRILFQLENLPPQEKIPDTGTYPAVMTDDGGLYVDTKGYGSHVLFIQAKKIPVSRIISGGWLDEGVYNASDRSDTMQYVERELAKQRVAEKRAKRNDPQILFQENRKTTIDGDEYSLLTTEDIMNLQDNGYKNSLYVRWSRGPKYDVKPSRDYAAGVEHGGLSAVSIDYWEKSIMDRRLSEYIFLRMKDSEIRPFIYTGNEIGKDSDGYSLLDVESIRAVGVWDEGGKILFQLTDPEIDAEARTFESWQKWKDYVEGFAIPAMDEDTRAPEGADLEAWYKTRWEQANGINRDEAGQEIDQIPELTSDEIDDRFRDRIRDDGELERFLEELQQARTNDYEHGALDAEEAMAREEAEALKGRIESEAHPTILNNALRVSMGREITPRARKAILTLMDQGARYYRSLYAEVTGDAEFAALSDREIDTMPEIQDTDEKSLSIVDRVKLANKIKSERVRKELMRGDLIPDDVMVLIDQLDQEKAELSAKLRAAEKEISEDNQLFTRQERIFVENRTKIADLQKSLQKNERDMAQAEKKLAQVRAREKAGRAAERERRGKLAEAYKAKAEKLKDTIADQRQELKDLRAATKDAMASARAEAVMQKKNAVDKLKDEIRAKEEERREAAKVIAYKRKLVAQIMAKPSREIWYEDAEKIRVIQRVVDPKARAATVKWAGETYEIQAFRDKAINENLVDILPKSLINRLFKKSLDEWTVTELEEMAAQVERLKSVGRTTWGLKEAERKYAEWKDRKDTIDQHASDPKLENAAAAGSKERREQLKKLDSGFRKLATVTWTTSRIADWLDGGKPGAHTKLLVAEEREAYAAKMDNMDRRTKKITDLMKEKGVDVRSLYETEHTISGIGPAGADATLTTSDLMYLMVGLRDANTRAAILYGNLMDQSERSTWDNDTLKSMGRDKVQALERSVQENLSEAEKEIAEAIGRDFRDEFGRLNDVFLNEFNMVMKQVDSYVPMIRQDVTASGEQHEAQQAQELLNVAGVSIKRTPEKGFSVSRVKISPRNQRAIKLDLYGTWMDAVERQEHFAAYTRYIRKLNGVYKNTQNSESRLLRHLITQTHGSEVLKRVDQEINALANPQSFRDDRNIDRLVRTLRGSLGSAYLAWKTSSILKQAVTSPAPYLAYVSAADMSSSAFEFMADYNGMSEMVRSKSAIMRHRVANPIFEAIKIAQKDSKGKKGLTTINAMGMRGLEMIDWVSVATGWNAVYKKALYEGATEKEAVAKADDVTIKTQPSAREQDLAPLFKTGSEAFKLITQFQTALNVIWNNFTYDLPNAVKNKQWGFVVGTIGSYAVAGIGLGLMTEGLKGDDDEADHSKWIYWSMSQSLNSVPLIGAGVSAVARQAITGEKRQFYASSVFPAADELLSAASRATAGDWDKAAVDFAESVGIGLGLPVSGVKEAIAAPGNPGRLIGRR